MHRKEENLKLLLNHNMLKLQYKFAIAGVHNITHTPWERENYTRIYRIYTTLAHLDVFQIFSPRSHTHKLHTPATITEQ